MHALKLAHHTIIICGTHSAFSKYVYKTTSNF